MAKKQRGKAGRAKNSSAAPNPNKKAERQTRKALRAQRRGKNYSDKDLKSFNRALADSGLVLREMAGDGNCFFRAISDQLEGNQHNHATYRARVCSHMEEMRDFYAPFIEDEDETFDEYMTRMSSDCEWAGQPELQAMATVCNVDIMVHQFEAPSYVVSGSTSGKMIHVSYHDGQHYNSVHPTAAVAASFARPTAPSVACTGGDGNTTPDSVYARAVSALDIQELPVAPSSRALAIVASVMEDMGGDSEAAHEFLLVDPLFAAACAAQPEPEPEPEPTAKSEVQTVRAGRDQSWTLDEQEKFAAGLSAFGKELGQERWVQIAKTVDSRTAADCKARYRKLCKEVKAGKEEEDRLSIQNMLEGSEAVDAGAAALEAKTNRLAQLRASGAQTPGVENLLAPAQELMADTRASVADASGDAGTQKQSTKKLKPSERRALKKAEKAARLEARARQRVAAAAAASNDGSDEEGQPHGATDTASGGLGWGVIQL